MSARPLHTPGPWYADGGLNAVYTESNPGRVATVESVNSYVRAADARLIAAAPDLLVIAKAYARECQCCFGSGVRESTIEAGKPVDCQHCRDARAAIAKAEGRS